MDLKEEIYARGPPTQLDQLIELGIHLDRCFEQRRRVRGSDSRPLETLTPAVVSSPLCSDPEPMQLGGGSHLCGGTTTVKSEPPLPLLRREYTFCFFVPVKSQSSPVDGGETISFFVFQSPYTPIVLGHPWLTQHNPQIDWVKGSILSWNLLCHVNCLVSAVPAVSSVSVFQEEPGDLSGVPEEYHDLRAVFSRSRATSLPPHRPYDCSIELLPGTMPPRGRLYSLSAPERGALENYLTESLAAGIIVPSSSPARARFFFVKKKDGSLRPCIDYRGLNDITVKNRYPLPLMSSAFEILQGAKVFTKLDLRNAYHLVRIKQWWTKYTDQVLE